jgi:hypothetical protein
MDMNSTKSTHAEPRHIVWTDYNYDIRPCGATSISPRSILYGTYDECVDFLTTFVKRTTEGPKP